MFTNIYNFNHKIYEFYVISIYDLFIYILIYYIYVCFIYLNAFIYYM